MTEQYQNQAGLQADRLGDDGGFIRAGVAVVTGVAVVGAAVVVGGGLWLKGQMPHGDSAPEDSRLKANQLTLDPTDIGCYSIAAFDVGGSQVRTKFTLPAVNFSFGGYGVEIKEGKVVNQTCLDPERGEVSFETGEVDGKTKKIVTIALSAIDQSSHISTGDTVLQRVNPPTTKIWNGAIDITSGTAEGVCLALAKIPFSPLDQPDCEVVTAVANWNDGNQALLQTALGARIEKFVQEDCGKQGFAATKLAITDGFRMQAKRQGGNPDDVVVRYVDSNGNPTDGMPNFKQTTWDKLFENGTLQGQLPGSPEIDFSQMECSAMSAEDYKSPKSLSPLG